MSLTVEFYLILLLTFVLSTTIEFDADAGGVWALSAGQRQRRQADEHNTTPDADQQIQFLKTNDNQLERKEEAPTRTSETRWSPALASLERTRQVAWGDSSEQKDDGDHHQEDSRLERVSSQLQGKQSSQFASWPHKRATKEYLLVSRVSKVK